MAAQVNAWVTHVFEPLDTCLAPWFAIFIGIDDDTRSASAGQIDTVKTQEDIRQEPLALPKGFEWVSVDIMDPVEVCRSMQAHT